MRSVPVKILNPVCLTLLAALSAGAAQVADLGRDGVGIAVDADPETVDVARDFYVTLTVSAPAGQLPGLPGRGGLFR